MKKVRIKNDETMLTERLNRDAARTAPPVIPKPLELPIVEFEVLHGHVPSGYWFQIAHKDRVLTTRANHENPFAAGRLCENLIAGYRLDMGVPGKRAACTQCGGVVRHKTGIIAGNETFCTGCRP